jgi:hypothetical protein
MYGYAAPGSCPQDVLPALTAEDFQRLPLAPTVTKIQPPVDHRILVNWGVIATADPAPQDLTTTLLGHPVTVHAVPATYTWDFGDRSRPLVTTEPGVPYPSGGKKPKHTQKGTNFPIGSHGYPYPHLGTYTITLTTTWTGTYQIDGSPTQYPITGTATTTTTHPPLTVTELHSHLVDKDCNQDPYGPGC